MHVVTVEFVVKPEHLEAFEREMIVNARTSRETEPGCRQFDVCRVPGDPRVVFLYEVYDDERAFKAHGASEHYQAFAVRTTAWVENKTVHAYERIDPR